MSYQVLARKYRPRNFETLVGQEHVVRALTHALRTGRLHHAYLFTGTRGVGKTTLSRILAKSLNCVGPDGQGGITAEPCGQCEPCRAIDAGRFVDYVEMDAASNRGVDEMAQLLEQAVYAPSNARFKVYMIDEVHMLTNHAFNAMLKTLEEPPEHVKFILATTDPQKIPVTVLSRCLQFNLKRLDEDQIQGQMTRILAAEEIESDPTAIVQLAKAADGSLRDGLSLLDQAIAYAGGALREDVVRTMLGTVDRTQVAAMLDALADGDGVRLLQVVAALAEFSPDWSGVLEALAEALHRIQVQQLVPGAQSDGEGIDAAAFAQRLRPEVVQLWYQMALGGRRDLYLAPSPRAGFEMAVLRMLAFRPAAAVPPVPRDPGTGTEVNNGAGSPAQGSGMAAAPVAVAAAPVARVAPPAVTPVAPVAAVAVPVVAPAAAPAPESPRPMPPPAAQPVPEDDLPPWHQAGAEERDEALAAELASPDAAMVAPWEAPPARPAAPAPAPVVAPAAVARPQGIAIAPSAPAAEAGAAAPIALASPEAWLELVAQSQLNGPSRQLAAHAAFISFQHGILKLAVSPGFEYLCSDRSLAALTDALSGPLGQTPRIVIEHGNAEAETLHQRSDRQRGERQQAAEAAFMADPQVQVLIQQHGARVVTDSIRPFDE